MTASNFRYGFRIVGATCEPRRLVDAGAAFAAYAACDPRANTDQEAYLSAFRFAVDFRQHLESTGSTAGFSGPCWSPWLWVDIDSEDLHAAHQDAGALADVLIARYGIDPGELLMFFSGSKGFHLGLPAALWSPAPSPDFHRTARRFAENVATAAAVTIDAGVYDRVRAFRAPNSRHPKTGAHKRRVTFKELTGPLDAIVELARTPAPFTLPTCSTTSDQAAIDWQAAANQVASEAEAKAARRVAGNGVPTLNRLTLNFIRQGAGTGDRHRLTFSAAANLAEFGCPPALAHALLTEPALDSGLPPKDVRRQIECGLAAAGSKPTQQEGRESTQTGPNESTVNEPPQRNTGDSGSSDGQSCQQATGATVPTAADLAALWNRPMPPAGGISGQPYAAQAGKRQQAPALPPDPPPIEAQPIATPKPAWPIPPPTAKLFFADKHGRPCSPAECCRWCWEGAARWLDAAEFPPPAAGKRGAP